MSAKVSELPKIITSQPGDELYIVRPSAGAAGSLAIQVNDLFSGVGRALPPRTDTVFANAAGGFFLHVYNLPNNPLPTDGSYFRFNGAGSLVINPANRMHVSLNISFVGSGYSYNSIQLDFGQVNFSQFNSWRMWGEIIRVNSSTLRAVITEIFGQSIISAPGSGPTGASGGHLIGTQDQTFTVPPGYFTGSSVSIQFTGGAVNNAQEVTVDDQVSQDLTTLELYQF